MENGPHYTEEDLAKIRNSGWFKELWKEVFENGGLRGRTWGRKRKEDNSPLRGSHATLGQVVVVTVEGKTKEEVVIINIRDGKLLFHEFTSTKGTDLGNKIRSKLEEDG